MTTTELKANLIDDRIKYYWEQVESKFNVTFSQASDGIYGCYTIGDSVTFYIDYDNLSKDSFAHEVLHAYVSAERCHISGCLKNTIKGNTALDSLFSVSLLDHIGNVMEHMKIYPIYCELGFDKNIFTIDYLESKLTKADVESLRTLYKSINYLASDRFVGKLIAALADPNSEIDYSLQLIQLRKFDPDLFDLTFKMIERWRRTKFRNVSVAEDDYNTVIWEYFKGLEIWIRKKLKYPLWWHKISFKLRN